MPFNGIPNLRDANEPVKLDLEKLREIKKCALDPSAITFTSTRRTTVCSCSTCTIFRRLR